MVEARDPWDAGGTYTREQLEAFRGPLTNGNHPEPELEAPISTMNVHSADSSVQLCALDGCSEPVTGHAAKFCCRNHQKRASHQRSRDRAAVLPQEVTNGRGIDESPSLPPSVLTVGALTVKDPGPFERLAGVASMLPPGWSAELSQSQVIIRW
jgi:hypothetical protein